MTRLLKWLLLALLRVYKRCLSPLLPPACRFVPTCSDYAGIAIRTHGPWRGGMLAVWRLLRCQPFCRGGYDPVPPANHVSACHHSAGRHSQTTTQRHEPTKDTAADG